MTRRAVLCSACLVLGSLTLADANAQPATPSSYQRYSGEPQERTESSNIAPPQLKDVTFRQKLNDTLPLDAMFKDENGNPVALGTYFGHRPVVLAFVYYSCPMLCTQVMNGISSALKVLPFKAGEDFDVVLVSFDPRDTPAIAAGKKQAHLQYWSVETTASAWHFLTGDEATIKRVTAAAGFNYRWDEPTAQFAHVSGVLVVNPDGKLSRYFYGVEYSPKDLRLALVESGQGHVGSAVDELLLYCYHYDPSSGKYGVVVMNLIRLGGVLTMLAMGSFILLNRRRDAHAVNL